jgi:hypothetical protein
MGQMADSVVGDEFTQPDPDALVRRLARVMTISVVVGVAAALLFAPWRFALGLALGGALSLLNFRWLHTSVAAVIDLNAKGRRQAAHSSRYLLRYLLVGCAVFAAYQLNLVSLPATIAGLCSFVPALMYEAARQFYLVIINREESF